MIGRLIWERIELLKHKENPYLPIKTPKNRHTPPPPTPTPNPTPIPSGDDGASGASNGPIARTDLANIYAYPPPHGVPGVTYAVGPRVGATKYIVGVDPLPTGFDLDTTNHLVRVVGIGNSIIGYDFTRDGGWGIYIQSGCGFPTIRDCVFKTGVNQHVTIQTQVDSVQGGVFEYNDVDGDTKFSNIDGQLSLTNTGVWTIRWNHIRNSYCDHIQLACSIGSIFTDIRFNLFQNNGFGIKDGAHPDFLQGLGAAQFTVTCDYNAYVMEQSGYFSQGIGLGDNFSPSTIVNASFSHNIFYLRNTLSGVNYATRIPEGQLQGTLTVVGNYYDPTGLLYGFLQVDPGEGPYSGTVVHNGNVNMLTGASD